MKENGEIKEVNKSENILSEGRGDQNFDEIFVCYTYRKHIGGFIIGLSS